MKEKFLQTIHEYNLIKSGDSIILGLSGGADSASLLHLLTEIRGAFSLKLAAVHVHHGLRGIHADNDLEYCERLCKSLDVPLESYFYNITEIAKSRGISIEEAGREKRYEAFRDTLSKRGANKIAVAHNMNDQAETLLMRLFRGTGLKGLAGMRPLTGDIIRPLLFTPRNEIEAYCRDNNLEFITDASNFDTEYTRSNIRRTILPQIEHELNTNIIHTLSRTALLLEEDNEFIEAAAEKHYDASENGLLIDELKKLDKALQKRIIRKAVSKYSLKDISYEHVNMITGLMNGPTGKRIDLPGGLEARRDYDFLCIRRAETVPEYCYELVSGEEIFVKEANMHIIIEINNDKFYEFCRQTECTKTFDYDKIMQAAMIRNRRPGDLICLNGMTKKLKKYFIDEKFPRYERDVIPLIADGENIIFISNGKASDKYKISGQTKKFMHIGILF